ncbi:TPA: DUF4839 domain-containing protein [Streptococcus suis]|uniref:DUF4839 domain-containing protein n=1 Tax=Streptococcus suis TaxID=1307 RepID=UPI000CF48747|nr:DUF4839 domain-containing protein [Streptococcus suis]HEM4974846.1 DUF4839 domain-containing protein [Streptococcus suis]HEM5058674.1 DUF4839 domain-containing protein [Streptococcus suis]HEM5069054.1 DUF4839 domain-containing protein [Streptococcus suis]HEM5156371.1 DUF4839 domain-containing protein [Streptococcus suis]HEM5165637.1 DUF4839 domain-containing protein [Streptococcus suis]
MFKKFLFLCIVFFASISLVACGGSSETTDTNKIAIPVGSSPEEADYRSVQKQLEDAGFENVSTQKIEDLTFGIFTKDGEIEKITVNGNESFSEGDLFEKDVSITIHYHTFKDYNNSEESKESSSEESSSSLKSSSSSSEQEVSTETSSSQTEQQTQVITPDNPDFAYILNNFDESKTQEFVEKYKGQIVEFDGHVAYMHSHENYKTRFDFLLNVGDWEEGNYVGMMAFENLAFHELKFVDETDTVSTGTNLHIKARIINAEKKGQLIYLEPVELRSR